MNKFLILVAAAIVAAALLGSLVSESPPLQFFSQENPLLVVSTLAASFAILSFLFGLSTRDYSWVDRLWSTAPVGFAWVYAWRSGMDPRLWIAAILVTLWGARLTYNFARKGGFTGVEDYRWPILRTKIGHPVLWQLFNLLFICSFQVGLFILFTSPLYMMYLSAGAPVTIGFLGISLLFVAFLTYETVADQQQWLFHKAKHGKGEGNRYASDVSQGFISSGLFRFSRHPNYFGELAIWWTLYVMGAVLKGGIINWTVLGPLVLSMLFVGSTWFTESITAPKYPGYAEYQRRTSAIIPWFPGKEQPEDLRLHP